MRSDYHDSHRFAADILNNISLIEHKKYEDYVYGTR